MCGHALSGCTGRGCVCACVPLLLGREGFQGTGDHAWILTHRTPLLGGRDACASGPVELARASRRGAAVLLCGVQ